MRSKKAGKHSCVVCQVWIAAWRLVSSRERGERPRVLAWMKVASKAVMSEATFMDECLIVAVL